MDAHLMASIFAQFPIVALVIWLFTKFRQYENESRARWFAYMKERDAALNDGLAQSASASKQIAHEVNVLGHAVTRLDARLKV